MKNLRSLLRAFGAVCSTLLFLVAAAPDARAQANASPPGKLTYQGFLTDLNGTPYGNTTPTNTTVIFKIYTASSGGTLKWAEQQTVTIDKGHFSVLLGEGSQNASDPFTNNLTSIFGGSDASDRYMELTVGGTTIQPRMQYLPAPYAMLAASARQIVDASGNVVITSTGSGANLTSLNASNLTSGTVADARISTNVALLNRSPQTFSGGVNSFSGNLGIGTTGPGVRLDVSGVARAFGVNPSFGLGDNTPTTRGVLGLATAGGAFSTDAVANDVVLRADIGKLLLQYGTGSSAITISTANYVGIGNTSPSYRLDVNGRARIVNDLVNSVIIKGSGNNTTPAELNFDKTVAGASHTASVGYATDRGLFFWVNGADRMSLKTSGYVGIGNNSPTASLEVTGGVRARGGVPGANGVNNNGFSFIGNNGDVDGGMYSSADGQLEFYSNAAEQMRLSGGNLGIGTTTPTAARLVVMGGPSTSGIYGSYINGSTYGSAVTHGAHNISIYGQYGIWAGDFVVASSDERIKTVLGRSDSQQDLNALLGIEIADYRYKDVIRKGSATQKKVIAQQVEKVFPQAVNQQTDVVPDIYQRASVKDGWVNLTTDLKKGDRVKLIAEKTEGIHEVLEVTKEKFRTDFKPQGDKVFVFGREVKDFRTVDYDAISMLNVSATQELARQVEAQKAELAKLRAEKAALAHRLIALEARDEAREARLIRLEKTLDGQGMIQQVKATTRELSRLDK